MRKTIIAIFSILLLANIAFSASSSKDLSWNDQTTTLYRVYTSPGETFVNIKPGFSGTYKTTITTSAPVLSYGSGGGFDGATMCPGIITVGSGMAGKWSAPSFYAHGIIFELDSANNPCYPASSTATAGYYDVNWNKNNYNKIKNVNLCFDNDPTCWGSEGTLQNKRIDAYRIYGVDYYDREGKVASTCWGTSTLSVSGGTFPAEGSQDTVSSASITRPSINLQNPGTYTISDGFQVKGCAMTLRHPVCSGNQVEEIFTRTAAQLGTNAPEYSKSLGANSFTIKVENRQNSIDFVSSDPAVPVILQPGEQILFSVLIENDGGVPTTVTGVTSTNPQISAIPFDTSLCSGPFASITEPCNGGNGFNQQINVGPTNARNLWMWLNSSATAPASTTLRFTHTTAYAVCNAQTTQTDFNLNPSGGQVVRCVVTPAVANVKQQQLYDFTVQCFDSANTQIPCIGNSWAFSGLAGWIPVATNTGATAGTHSPVGSTGRLVYTTGTVSCASNLTVNASTESIDVQPPSANLKQNQTQGFTATCTAGGNPSACTGNQWDPYSTLIGSLSGSSANGTTYTATVDNVTTQLYAVAFGLNPTNPPYDWADITVGSGGSNGGGDDKNGESQYCIIVNSTLYAGMVNPFYVLCKTTNGAIVSCQSAGKSPIWIFGASSYTNNPQGILLTASDTGKTLRAQVAPNEYCDLELDVRDNPYACIMYS